MLRYVACLLPALASTAVIAQAQLAPKSSPSLTVYPLRNQNPEKMVDFSCGCYLYTQSNWEQHPKLPTAFQSGWDPKDSLAWANVGGNDITLKLVSVKDPKVWKKGASSIRVYEYDTVSVRCELTVSGECPPNTHCDGVPLRGTMQVTVGEKTRSVRVWGFCGC